jgi:hypothetical protein
MDTITFASIEHISDIVNQLATEENWSVGADGAAGSVSSVAYLILEELYHFLDSRPEVSSIKLFNNVTDPLAYEWHVDNSNPTETSITKTVLVYLPKCEGSVIEFKSQSHYVNPYDVIILDSNVDHRAVGQFHGPVLKYTFL